MLKMVVNDNETYTKLQEIGGRALAESKGGTQRTRDQLAEDTAFMAELSKRFSDEANLMRNIEEKDKTVKHTLYPTSFYLIGESRECSGAFVRTDHLQEVDRPRKPAHS